jgi:hypothetical protein
MEPNYKGFSEDEIKKAIKDWLEKEKWTVQVAWGKTRGADIEAHRGNECWIIEAKGHGTRNPMRVNYFLMVLGEILQRMGDKNAKYSIGLPNYEQFQKLWTKLPQLVKTKTGITCLFVDSNGRIVEK